MPRLQAHSPLRVDLKRAVDDYFQTTGYARHGGAAMCLKTATLFAWASISWALLVFWATSWAVAVPLAVSLGLALAGIGFCVMHDGGHGSYSDRAGLNRLAAYSLDLLGGSSFVWNQKHNVLHHTYTNIEGADDDIEFEPFFRLSEGQPRRWFHRLQFLYWPLLLVFLSPKWVFLDDFVAVARGGIAGHPMPRLKPRDWVVLLAGKLAFVLWGVVIPLLVVGPLPYLIGYAIVCSVLGITLGTVFQLAHAVEEATFYRPLVGEQVPLPWAEHQLATTVDFARGNRLLTWYVGGLNHQVEHHLFPRISHRHYPALATIVREVCARHGVDHHDHVTLTGAIRSHVRHLYRLGRPSRDAIAAPAAVAEPPELPVTHSLNDFNYAPRAGYAPNPGA